MQATRLALPEVILLQPRIFSDHRGDFFESYNERAFQSATGLDVKFVQDNHSYSRPQVVRGLHYQIRQPQGKLVRVISGEVFEVVVDLRRSSPGFGRWLPTLVAGSAPSRCSRLRRTTSSLPRIS